MFYLTSYFCACLDETFILMGGFVGDCKKKNK